MALLTILEFPDPRLRTIAKPVQQFDKALQLLIDDMLETMYTAPGIGLAATQVNVHKQLLVMDISENKDTPLVFINPVLSIIDDELESYDEGCLSVPGYYETVTRPKNISVTALDRQGKNFTITDSGLLAICIQHEMDHLNGKLFVDYLSVLKRNRIKSKLEKAHKQQAAE
jgi:peptide deformylase